MMIGYYEIPVDICNKNIIIYYDNVTGSKESSFNQNSNPGPLTDRASDQTTELLIPTNIQDIPLEGPSAGMLEFVAILLLKKTVGHALMKLILIPA